MAVYQFEDNSAVVSGCNIHNDGTRTFVKDAVNVGAYVENTLTGLAAGWYDLSINYSQGFGGISPWKLSINSVRDYTMLLETTNSWGNWLTNYITKVYLDAGTNILRFSQFGLAADLDFYDLTFSTNQNNSMSGRIINLNGTSEDVFTVGSHLTAGTKTLRFLNNNPLNLRANPTAERAIDIPDESGTISLLSNLPTKRQNSFLVDSSFTSNNYDLALADANQCIVCENTVASSITLTDLIWETNDAYAEIEILRTNAAVQIVVGTGLSSIGTSTFNLSTGGICLLKHIKDKVWFIKGDFE